MTTELKKTPLYQTYLDQEAKVIDFSGWALPVQFSSIKEEHNAVRENVGLFDVSHMGEIIISGEDADEFVQYILTNDSSNLTETKAQYTALCNEQGGVIDDLVIYKLQDKVYFLVVNAGNTDIDFEWIQSIKGFNVTVENKSTEYGQLAIQGPNARKLLQEVLEIDISEMKMFEFIQNVTLFGKEIILSQSGYTGEDGFEIYCDAKDAKEIWDQLIEQGAIPCGLGARDTLRLEAALPLHGQDLSESITPYEAGIGFAVKPLIEDDFIGKSVLKEQKTNGAPRKSIGIEMIDKGIPRTDYDILDLDGNKIGYVTSGTQSPSTGKSFAMGLIDKDAFELEKEVLIQVRKRQVKAKIVKKSSFKS
ncbi:glycine cleavage system aminomethyltransferase GcvT [Mammaliicoccus sp. Dog046]|uniref:glycine cleavage system aminomethyltransferase GcvT n=1 Tax=Mammaliicoccus sp. Dog046 TaxID=3034233 RepID=UPI002B25DCE2|nr:glycine cleavage system aminomethyltransferase GcvT [Mammaliicoccus sp. Dog046]WQK86626.1 glycine cleavage system aminomethyltransferase GcvT [Mammaliicoccus sp. Dog046]